MRNHLGFVILLTAASAAACTKDAVEERPNLPANLAVDPHPRLAAFAGCPELEASIEDAQVLRMRSLLEELRLRRGFWDVGGDAAPPPTAQPVAEPSSYTSTNAQVEGVGEADVVQNDGTRIALLAGGSLRLLRSWPAAALAEASSVAIEGWPHHLFLSGDRAVVFSEIWQPRDLGEAPVDCGGVGLPAAASPPYCGPGSDPAVKLTALDVSDLAAPRVVSELYLPGSYVSARLAAGRIRLVTTAHLSFPADVGLWPALGASPSRDERAAALADLATANEARIRAATLEDWLRPGTLRRPGQPDASIGWDCTAFHHGTGAEAPGFFSVVTLDLEEWDAVDRVSVFAAPSTIYASARTLYVASPHWYWWLEPGQRSATYLHAFDISDPARATYAGSGVVDGRVADPYSLDEQGSHLRVVTTTEERNGETSVRTAGRLSVLARAGGALEPLGRTEEFGTGEQVFATRFLGTRGFVITAAVTDPLFAIDLTDPAAPRVVGDLEMPGFVSYLHPIDETHLLGIGRDGGSATEPSRVKVALFDVSELAHPREVSRVVVGDASWDWSDALWDPKAFTWYGDRKLLAVPYASWGMDTLVSDLRLFRVDPSEGITPAGVLSLADVYAGERGTGFGWSWSPFVTRSILADDFVYAVSDAGVRAARVADLPDWLATVVFPRPDLP